MKSILKPVLAAGMLLATASPLVIAAPASAQVVPGIAAIDVGVIVSGSNAFKAAEQQRGTYYAQTVQQAQARGDAINQQIDPMITKLEADSKLPNANREALQQQAAAIQQISTQGQREVNQLLAPVMASEEYVAEQISEALPKAIEEAAKKKRISLVLRRDEAGIVYRDPAYNLNDAVIAELNTLLPAAQIVPPPNWLPRELREQQARAAAAAGQTAAPATGAAPAAAPVAAPAGPPAESR